MKIDSSKQQKLIIRKDQSDQIVHINGDVSDIEIIVHECAKVTLYCKPQNSCLVRLYAAAGSLIYIIQESLSKSASISYAFFLEQDASLEYGCAIASENNKSILIDACPCFPNQGLFAPRSLRPFRAIALSCGA